MFSPEDSQYSNAVNFIFYAMFLILGTVVQLTVPSGNSTRF